MAEGEHLESLFSKLDGFVQNQQKKKALKTVEEILKLAPDDVDALTCKTVLLIDSHKFHDALHLLKNPSLAERLQFEKAYSLYRLCQYAESYEALQLVGDDRLHARQQLTAQLHYRTNAPDKAIEVYNKLFRELKEKDLELQTNVVAAYVAGNRSSELDDILRGMRLNPQDSFEVAFNVACGRLEEGKLDEAQAQLEAAQRQGRETLLEEDYDEEQVEDELSPIAAQLAYIDAARGNHRESLDAIRGLLKLEMQSTTTAAVLQNNLWVERLAVAGAPAKKLVMDGIKKLEPLVEKGSTLRLEWQLEHRLSRAQKLTIHVNRALLLLMAGKLEACADLVNALNRLAPDADSVVLLKAALVALGGNPAEADELLSHSGSLHAILMRAQLAIDAGNLKQAAELMRDLGSTELDTSPAVVATRAALLEALGEPGVAAAMVDGALAWLEDGMGEESEARRAEKRRHLLQLLARLKLKTGDMAGVVELYGKLQAAGAAPDATADILAGIARLAAVHSPGAAGALVDPLRIAEAGNVDALENIVIGTTLPRKTKYEDGPGRKAAAAGGAANGEQPSKKKRKKKPRLPKGFDAANPGPPPDPERWLPKHERAEFKKKNRRKKDREAAAVKGSQGAGKVDESLDRTVDSGADTSPDAKPGAKPAGRPAAASGNRNKKKGRR